MPELNYKPDGKTLKAFMLSDKFFRGLRGPVGSGKSVCCCIELFRRALAQEPGADGLRKTRWAVVRNTNPQLKTTTIKTWLDWFPESIWGKFNWSPPFTHHIRRGDIDCEVIFLALDRPEDVKKLLSLELTGVFINEAREIPKSIVDATTMRVNRYPSMKDGGCTWSGVIADTNAPDDDHWWPIMAGEAPMPDHVSKDQALMLVKPPDWEFFTQPGGMIAKKDKENKVIGYERNPKAENANNLAEDYYTKTIQGKSKDWISVYVLNQLGNIQDGKPVYPDFDVNVHVAKEDLVPVPDIPITIGLDFGLTPAAAFCQHVRGRWLVLGEFVATDMGTAKFADVLKKEIASRFPDHKCIIWGDPSGDYRAQTDETTPFQILRASKVVARAAPTNDPSVRIGAVERVLTRMTDGQPAFLLSPSAVMLKRGFEGGYQYRRLQTSGERYDDKPDKNKYSHVHDALQYAFCGGGESRELLIGGEPQQPVNARKSFDVFAMRRNRPRSSFTFG